jgi:hypothetical protein
MLEPNAIFDMKDAIRAEKRVRITWRETPDKGFGKPRTVHEVVMANNPDELHENFWSRPAWNKSQTRKVEITEVKWLED